jgi:hypothetical protein
MSCVPKDNFPFDTVCQKLLGEGKPCMSNLVCDIEFTCWPQTVKDAVSNNYTCTEMYTREIGTEIGYKQDDDNAFKNSIIAGELCKSGIALIRSKTSAICAEITSVRTNVDNFLT